MINELLIKLGLQKPNIYDIMNKIMTDGFTKEELNTLYKVGPFFYNTSNGSTIKLDYQKHFDAKCIILFLYNSVYCLPDEKDLFKYLPEIKLAIQECKRTLPKLLDDYNKRRQEIREMQKKKEQCIMKVWEMIR